MNRMIELLSVVFLLGTMLVGGGALVGAQDATPTAEEDAVYEYIGSGVTETLPSGPAELLLFRIMLAPGATLSFSPDDPSVVLAVVEAGVVTFQVEATVTVWRAGELGAQHEETIPAGEACVLEPGDSAVFPPNIEGEVRNDGTEPGTIMVSNIAPVQDSGPATPEAATP